MPNSSIPIMLARSLNELGIATHMSSRGPGPWEACVQGLSFVDWIGIGIGDWNGDWIGIDAFAERREWREWRESKGIAMDLASDWRAASWLMAHAQWFEWFASPFCQFPAFLFRASSHGPTTLPLVMYALILWFSLSLSLSLSRFQLSSPAAIPRCSLSPGRPPLP